MPTTQPVASVKSGADPASDTTKTNKLGQELKAQVKGQSPETSPNQATEPTRTGTGASTSIRNSSKITDVGQPIPASMPDTPLVPTGSTQPTTMPADITDQPDPSPHPKAAPNLSPGQESGTAQTSSTPSSEQSVQTEPVAGNTAARQQPMSRVPRTPQPPVGQAESAAGIPASTPAGGEPPSTRHQVTPPITSADMPTSAATQSPNFGQTLRSDQPAVPAQPKTPGHQAAAPVTQPPPAPPAGQRQNPPAATPAAQEVSPTPDAAAPPTSSASKVPGSKAPAPPAPKEPPTRKEDARQQQKTAKAKSTSNRRKPLKSPRKTGGQS